MLNTPAWLWKRQQAYDQLVETAGKLPDRTSREAFDLHESIVEQLDRLPIAEGGRP